MYHGQKQWQKEKAYICQARIIFSKHFLRRAKARKITLQEIETIINNGEIIQGHAPFGYKNNTDPVRVIMGNTKSGRVLHVVVALRKHRNIVVLVTAYEPDLNIWKDDLKTLKPRDKKK